jgi:predicted nucleic acid-binding protein
MESSGWLWECGGLVSSAGCVSKHLCVLKDVFCREEMVVVWGRVVSLTESAGRPISAMDAFLAATAQVHDLTLVTRNVDHFWVLKTLLSPWT